MASCDRCGSYPLEARTSRTSARSPDVSCRGAAARCRAALLGRRTRAGPAGAAGGRRSRSTARSWRAADPQALHAARGARPPRACAARAAPSAPQLWSPDAPRLYSAKFTLRDRDRVVQVEKRRVGLRSVEVKGGLRISTTAASSCAARPSTRTCRLGRRAHERRHGPHRGRPEDARREHHASALPAQRAAAVRLDRAGIMVWSWAPIWQRDAGAHLLWQRKERARALETVRRTVTAARSCPPC